jgi:hypothetical protein
MRAMWRQGGRLCICMRGKCAIVFCFILCAGSLPTLFAAVAVAAAAAPDSASASAGAPREHDGCRSAAHAVVTRHSPSGGGVTLSFPAPFSCGARSSPMRFEGEREGRQRAAVTAMLRAYADVLGVTAEQMRLVSSTTAKGGNTFAR